MAFMTVQFLPIASIRFGDPTMLLWGLAALVPILIHWLTRQRQREVVWAAMTFLLAAVEKHSRRIRIQQWLLLAMRIVTLLLFAVVLSDMSFQNSQEGVGSMEGPRHTVIVVDGSFSMAYRSDGERLFDKALDQAIALVEESSPGDGFTLIVLGDPPQTVIGTPVFDRAEVVREIRLLTLSHQRGNLTETLSMIDLVLEKSQQCTPQLRGNRICCFTDMGRSTWGELDTVLLKKRYKELTQRGAWEWIDVGVPQAENWAVSSLRLSPTPFYQDRRVQFLAECHYYGCSQRERQRIEWFVDGKRVEQQDVSLAVDKPATVRLDYQFATPGEHVVEVRLSDDPLEIDNHGWFSIPIRDERRILCVNGKPEAAYFVRLALQSDTSKSIQRQPELASEFAIRDRDLSNYDCVILCNLKQIDKQQAKLLFGYLDKGGAVIVFLGDQVVASAYNQFIGGADNPYRILPAEIGVTVEQVNHGFRPLEYRHPIVQPFRGNEQAGLLTTPVWKYFQLYPYREEQSDIVLAFQDGNPAIVAEKIADGICLLVATAASTASVAQGEETTAMWTAWPTWPSFPPLVHEMVSYATQGQVYQRNVMVNQSFSSSLSRQTQKTTVHIHGPQSRQRVLRADENRWTFSETTVSGVYTVGVGNLAAPRKTFAVNVDVGESDLERYESNLLTDLFLPNGYSERTTASQLDKHSWLRYLLIVLGILLLLESYFAWRWNVAVM